MLRRRGRCRPRGAASARRRGGTDGSAPSRRGRSARACCSVRSRTSESGRWRRRRPCASSSYTVWAMNWCSGFWKTKPMREDSVRASRGDVSGSRAVEGSPIRTVPRGGGTTPAIAWMSVVLPAPFAPTIATNSPGADIEVDAVEHAGAAPVEGEPAHGDERAAAGRSAIARALGRPAGARDPGARREAASPAGRILRLERGAQLCGGQRQRVERDTRPAAGAGLRGWTSEARRRARAARRRDARRTTSVGPSATSRPSWSSTTTRSTKPTAASRLCSTSRIARSPAETRSASAA